MNSYTLYFIYLCLFAPHVLGEIAYGRTHPIVSSRSQMQHPSQLGKRKETELYYKFVTRPDIGAPRWDLQIYDEKALSPGYWFVAPYANLDQTSFPKWNGPHIYDGDGELVWSGAPLFDHWNVFDFRIVKVGGKAMLSLIFPHDPHAEGVILDSNYEVYKALDLIGDLKKSNMHDFTVVENGEIALTLSDVVGRATVEQSKVIGWDGQCKAHWEGFKELRVKDGEVLFDWSARDWISMNESTFINPVSLKRRCDYYWDILHLNSIDKFPDGDYLISSRHMDAIYKISHEDGHVVWRLGGKRSDFELNGPSVFSRQHHARVHGQNKTHTLISLFDNASGDGPQHAEHATNTLSRGLLLALRTDTEPMTAGLVAHYDHPHGRISNSRGSMQFLPNGNIFMGWTYQSRQSEHAQDGILLMEASFRENAAHSYRNFKFPWVGRPYKPPDVHSSAVNTNDTHCVHTVAYVSWNGATEVASWRLYKTTANGSVRRFLSSTKKSGFETTLSFAGYASFVVIEARDKYDKLLEFGTSNITKTIKPNDTDCPEVATEMRWLQNHSGSTSPGEELWHKLSSFVQSPLTLFVLVFIIFAIVVWGVIRRRSRASPSWWKRRLPLYRPLSGWSRSEDEVLESYPERADEFELESNDEYNWDDQDIDASKPLVRREKDDGRSLHI